MQTLRIRTHQRSEMINITAEVAHAVTQSGVKRGLCLIHVPHTTAGIIVQEGYDPDVARDLLVALEALAPAEGDYAHAEGNSPAHIKSLMTGPGKTLPIEYGTLQLGRWQTVFLCEFDGPRERSVWVQIIKDHD